MTYYDKLVSVMTPLRLAYLMSKTTSCGDCPAKDKCEGKYDEYKCLETMRDYLESEVKENDR